MIDVSDIAIERNTIPKKNEPVRSLKNPKSIGPTPPPRLPIELMKPMQPAAVASLRNRLGSDQKAGEYAFVPIDVMVKRAIIVANGWCRIKVRPKPIAPIRIGIAV